MKFQMENAEKASRSDFVIRNDGNRNDYTARSFPLMGNYQKSALRGILEIKIKKLIKPV